MNSQFSEASRFDLLADTIRVLIGDDHRIVREGLKQILADAPDVAVVAEAQNGDVSYRPGQYGGSVFTISLMAVAEPPLSEPPVEGAGGPALQDPSPDQS